jgi:hypothetical protein
MEELIKELKEIFTFKDSTREGDIVLIAARKPPMLIYALVTAITRDGSKRDEWWHVALQLLTIPPQKIVWTLREAQFTGREVFTMAGEERFIKALSFPVSRDNPPENRRPAGHGKPGPLRVVK